MSHCVNFKNQCSVRYIGTSHKLARRFLPLRSSWFQMTTRSMLNGNYVKNEMIFSEKNSVTVQTMSQLHPKSDIKAQILTAYMVEMPGSYTNTLRWNKMIYEIIVDKLSGSKIIVNVSYTSKMETPH